MKKILSMLLVLSLATGVTVKTNAMVEGAQYATNTSTGTLNDIIPNDEEVSIDYVAVMTCKKQMDVCKKHLRRGGVLSLRRFIYDIKGAVVKGTVYGFMLGGVPFTLCLLLKGIVLVMEKI